MPVYQTMAIFLERLASQRERIIVGCIVPALSSHAADGAEAAEIARFSVAVAHGVLGSSHRQARANVG